MSLRSLTTFTHLDANKRLQFAVCRNISNVRGDRLDFIFCHFTGDGLHNLIRVIGALFGLKIMKLFHDVFRALPGKSRKFCRTITRAIGAMTTGARGHTRIGVAASINHFTRFQRNAVRRGRIG